LRGRVAIVTGAAQGIGLGIAKSLGEEGARVVINDVQEERLAAAREALAGHEVLAVVADVSRREDVKRLVESTVDAYGGVDILVNNAGVLLNKGFLEHSEEEWNRVVGINLGSVFLCCQAVLPLMIEAGKGAVVNLASIAAFHSTVPHTAYSASKAAIACLTRDLAYEMAPHGVRVNAVSPGMVATSMARDSDQALGKSRLVDSIPLGDWGAPSDIGDAVVFLASDRARYIVGQTVTVSGGADLSILPR
jgi:NAD(P)-dependent dehydrogenase (short-subunit alcohol dehydrogenase family)